MLNLGLKIYTNFDPKIQDSLSTSMSSNLVGIKQASNVSMVVLNKENSGIGLYMVGKIRLSMDII